MSMKTRVLCAATAATLIVGAVRPILGQSNDQFTLKFSDPSKSGTVDITLLTGSITVHGSNRSDVLIEAHARNDAAPRRGRAADTAATNGLRRLTQPPGFEAEEQHNVISVNAGGPGLVQGIDFDLQVPTRTNLKLSSVNNGTITVTDVNGEFEVNNVNGAITLTNVAGSVVAHSVNGKIAATLTRGAADKPMAFTSLNGGVDVTLPASIKATFKLRSDRGDVFTDFDMQTRPAPAVQDTGRSSGGRYRIEVNTSIYGSVNGGGPEIEMRTFNGNVYLRKGK
jgi:hypothetical protein